MNSDIILTILAAVLIMGLVVAGLSIGLILTGKSRLKKRCGQSIDESSSCSLCGNKDKCKKEPHDNDCKPPPSEPS